MTALPAADKHLLEEGDQFTPRFDEAGLVVCVTTEAGTGAVLMVAYMNRDALIETLATGIVTYWSRSRRQLWRKGETSGQIQHLVEMRTDCDQDTLVLRVEVGGDGGACHTGRHSCFYRRVERDANGSVRLVTIALTRSERSHPSDSIGHSQAAEVTR